MTPTGHAAGRLVTAALVLVGLLAGCTADGPPEAPAASPTGVSPTGVSPTGVSPTGVSPTGSGEPTAAGTGTERPAPVPRVRPRDARVRTAVRVVRRLAGEVGPRPGHSPAYFRAAAWVEQQLERHGWQVTRQRFPTPAGVSWGVPVDSGPSVNLVATRGDVRPGRPWLLVGAHLDTVPQAPGAEDNASGVGVMLAVAEALDGRRTRLPVVLVAFGSEEPRGPTDADHHYGSRAYVAGLAPRRRRTLRGMVSLDRVGVGQVLPVGSAAEPSPLRAELLRAARAAGARSVAETGQRSSDHWSFVREGLPGVRLGGAPYPAYHSPADTPDVVDPAQLERAARTVLAWLR